MSRHEYLDGRCLHCEGQAWKIELYDLPCVDREPITYTTETPQA